MNRHDYGVPKYNACNDAARGEGCSFSRLRVVSANACTLFPQSAYDNSADARVKSNFKAVA